MPVQKEQRLNIFSMVSPACEYLGFDSTESINGERLADYLDGFSRKIDRPTFIVLDNASIHRKGEEAKKMKDLTNYLRYNEQVSWFGLVWLGLAWKEHADGYRRL